MKKKILALVATVALAVTTVFGLTACNNDTAKTDWDYIQKKGKMVVGYTDYPPLDIKENGQVTGGFDYELALAVGEKLGLKVEFYEIVDWGNKVLDINAKKIDCIWNGMTVSEELKKNLTLSNSYMRNKQAVVVKKGETRYTDLNSLKGSKIGAEKGSAGAAFIENNNLNPDYKKADKQLDLFMQMQSGLIDVAVLDSIMAGYYMSLPEYEGNYEVLEIASLQEEFAIGFRKGDTTFAGKVNNAIAELKADGTVEKLAAKYGLASEIL